MSIRPAAVAGLFYPSGPIMLRDMIELELSRVELPDAEPSARGYIVPHAGYRFSGSVAAHVYARLRRDADTIERVVLIGPSHRVALRGFAGTAHSGWQTPLGTADIANTSIVVSDDAFHEQEHSLEVQVPFLQTVLPGVPITPVAVGAARSEEVAQLITEIIDDGSVLLCSTDLSHYLDQSAAQARDRATADAILGLAPQRIQRGDACGLFPLRGTLQWAADQGLTPTELDLRTSADTYGGRDRVVGYSAFSFI